MTEKIKELLAVLDMPEGEQISWVNGRFKRKHKIVDAVMAQHYGETSDIRIESLADLAFRLRDEVWSTCPTEWGKALRIVWKHCRTSWSDYRNWWLAMAGPIHWIIAALIAKELAKSGKTKNGT